MTCTLFTERPGQRQMEFAYPDFQASVDFGLARSAVFASVDRNYPNAELMEIQTDQPHLREVWVKRGGAWERNGGVH
ncbi:MAG TPA: hypothetical protein VKT30_01460 [Caulobacteraceae bacterium]|nr:hypothetical protein [Caulobacteraceae bacterium]